VKTFCKLTKIWPSYHQTAHSSVCS